MLHTKRTTVIVPLFGAMALLTAAPAFAQPAPAPAAAVNAAPADNAAAPADNAAAPAAPEAAPERVGGKNAGHLDAFAMFMDAKIIVKFVMVGLAICSLFSWTILILKLFEFGA